MNMAQPTSSRALLASPTAPTNMIPPALPSSPTATPEPRQYRSPHPSSRLDDYQCYSGMPSPLVSYRLLLLLQHSCRRWNTPATVGASHALSLSRQSTQPNFAFSQLPTIDSDYNQFAAAAIATSLSEHRLHSLPDGSIFSWCPES
ncbi:glycoprotein hormones alpha chain [Striga asiatica]|uniref:Glycoprotein hormones alpha chain n=1 Tax=Striga asiatica TaxID=4170 RepID=A0A5A7NYM4_STRAF|nr:glycoprotein hormones alpha chain [Striga asiatica]